MLLEKLIVAQFLHDRWSKFVFTCAIRHSMYRPTFHNHSLFRLSDKFRLSETLREIQTLGSDNICSCEALYKGSLHSAHTLLHNTHMYIVHYWLRYYMTLHYENHCCLCNFQVPCSASKWAAWPLSPRWNSSRPFQYVVWDIDLSFFGHEMAHLTH